MSKITAVSPAELEILEFLWAQGTDVPAKEIMEYFNGSGGKEWKKQTLNTFLSNLYKKGMIRRISVERRYHYEPQITKAEYEAYISEQFVLRTHGGSFISFVSSLAGSSIISKEEAEAIKKILKKDA